MKKILFSLIALGTLFLTTPTFALDLGSKYTQNAANQAGFAPANETTFSETVGTVIKAALSMVGTIFLVLTVYAGFLWMTAQGDEGKVEKAQNIIRAAVIGMVITLGAYGITEFVVGRVIQQTTTSATPDEQLQDIIE